MHDRHARLSCQTNRRSKDTRSAAAVRRRCCGPNNRSLEFCGIRPAHRARDRRIGPIAACQSSVRSSVGPADLQTVFDPKGAMAPFENLRLQPPRGTLLVRWEQQFKFRVCSADRPNRAH
jgi:hypothetical protein